VFAFYGGAVAAAAITGLIASTFAPPEIAAVVGVGAAVPFAALARVWWNRTAARARAQLTRLADEIADLLRSRSE
jgi:Flp pilus assembly protein TadB